MIETTMRYYAVIVMLSGDLNVHRFLNDTLRTTNCANSEAKYPGNTSNGSNDQFEG